MEGLVACVAYAEGRRVGDVAIPDISEVLKQPLCVYLYYRFKRSGWL